MTKDVASFLVAVNLTDYATVGDYRLEPERIVVGLSQPKEDLNCANSEMAKRLGVQVQEVAFDGQKLSLVRFEGLGYFGFVQSKFNPAYYEFVIYNETYPQDMSFKEFMPYFFQQVELAVSPHLENIKNKLEVMGEGIQKEASPKAQALKEKFLDLRSKIFSKKD